jgi:hypothetical protein
MDVVWDGEIVKRWVTERSANKRFPCSGSFGNSLATGGGLISVPKFMTNAEGIPAHVELVWWNVYRITQKIQKARDIAF